MKRRVDGLTQQWVFVVFSTTDPVPPINDVGGLDRAGPDRALELHCDKVGKIVSSSSLVNGSLAM